MRDGQMSRAEERLTEFLKRLCEDYDKIQVTFPGLRRGQIKAMLCQLDYVQYFALVPLFCRAEPKLPKGCKKTGGHKIIMTGGRRKHKEKWTEYLIECGSDLYVSGVIGKRSPQKSERQQWLVVEDWKTMTAMQVVGGIEQNGAPMPGEIKDAIFRLYKDNGLPIGAVEPILRNL